MDISSKTLIHAGINFIMIPMPRIDSTFKINIQRFLDEAGILISKMSGTEKELVLVRERPEILNIKVALLEPPVGQLLIVKSTPQKTIDSFRDEAENVVNAFELAAQTSPRQIIKKDAAVRHLYETDGEHAFQEIWEGILEQQPETLKKFGHQVLGGGLRFVLSPELQEEDPAVIEIKIESFLKDPSKIFVETQYTWERPSQPGVQLMPGVMIQLICDYSEQIVEKFFGGQDA